MRSKKFALVLWFCRLLQFECWARGRVAVRLSSSRLRKFGNTNKKNNTFLTLFRFAWHNDCRSTRHKSREKVSGNIKELGTCLEDLGNEIRKNFIEKLEGANAFTKHTRASKRKGDQLERLKPRTKESAPFQDGCVLLVSRCF